MDLVVLAAGMGSRFGGSKQTEEIDAFGNFIIDYSIFDALKVGFDRIVLVIKKENLEVFQNTLGSRVPKEKLFFAFQTNDVLKENNINRAKPLGTGHAVLCAKDVVKNNNFCMINADDFYGRNSFKIAHDFLEKIDKNSNNFGLVGYALKNTLSSNGSVKRGVCEVENGFVKNITECKISENKEPITIKTLKDDKEIEYNDNLLANMNMLCLTPSIFSELEKGFKEFCKSKENLEKEEFMFSETVGDLVKQGKATLKLLKTDERWIGMTYREDLESVIASIKELQNKNIYPVPLWN